jgi:hypothetical protein
MFIPGSTPGREIGQPMSPRLTGFTLLFLLYAAEVVLPIELKYGSPRVCAYQLDTAEGPERTPLTYSKNQGTQLS